MSYSGRAFSLLKARTALQYYRSIDHAGEVFSTYFGPTIRALETIDPEDQENLLEDLNAIMSRYNQGPQSSRTSTSKLSQPKRESKIQITGFLVPIL